MEESTLLKWRKSSYSNSNGGNCVEVATLPDGVAVRDSKDLARGHLALSAEAFGVFMSGIKGGTFAP